MQFLPMQIRKAYNYFYWRCYDLIFLTGEFDLGWGASHFMSFILCLVLVNIYRTLQLYDKFTHIQTSVFFLFVFIALELFKYLLFVRNEKHKEIIASHKKENQRTKKAGRMLLVFIIIYLTYSLF
jgi:hypothetical protein